MAGTAAGLIVLAARANASEFVVLDQSSPRILQGAGAASFSIRSMWSWQQEFRPTTSGTIDSFILSWSGPIAGQLRVRVRPMTPLGPGAPMWDQRITKQSTGTEDLQVDLSAAAIPVVAGERYILDLSGGGVSGLSLAGSYVEPPNLPLYSYPLLYAGVPFSNGGWRVGFDLYVNPDVCITDINGDGGIDEGDLSEFFRAWESGSPNADVNRDGAVDFGDATVFLDHWALADC